MKNAKVIRWLLSYVKPLTGKMALAITLGMISNLSVIVISMLGVTEAIHIFKGDTTQVKSTLYWMLLCGVIRGVARYCEQYLNHDIAFRLLAVIRANIFAVLRKLGPARLSGKKSGDLVTAITSDVEALEVFFAHTISPCLIAIGTSIATVLYLAKTQWLFAVILVVGQLIVGVWIPLRSYQKYRNVGDDYQAAFVALNQEVMENVASLNDVAQFKLEKQRLTKLHKAGERLNQEYKKRLKQGSLIQINSEAILLVTAVSMMLIGNALSYSMEEIAIGTVLSLSSFGSVFALSGLGNALLTTLASANRLYELAHEPVNIQFNETGSEVTTLNHVAIEKVSFAYEQEMILKEVSLAISKGESIGIGGPSGSGKSTLLKLLMRYYDPQAGSIQINQLPLTQVKEEALHTIESVLEQTTFLFEDTLAFNIGLGKAHATMMEIEEAAKKAAIHEWITSLPEGYQTKIGNQTRLVSDGERQRIGLARLFLHDGSFLLLDEPTSNLDYVNEQAILQTLQQSSQGKTTLIVSHRPTTLAIADQKWSVKDGKLSKQ